MKVRSRVEWGEGERVREVRGLGGEEKGIEVLWPKRACQVVKVL